MRNELVTAIRVMARILAGIMILIYGFALVSILEGGHNPLPFVLEGAPFGTYRQSTQLGILTLGAGWGLSLVGAILLFWWERTAAMQMDIFSLISSTVLLGDRTSTTSSGAPIKYSSSATSLARSVSVRPTSASHTSNSGAGRNDISS